MADRMIGELPHASELQDSSLLVMEQSGQAMNISGAQLKEYAKAGVQSYVEQAATSATNAAASAAAAANSAAAADIFAKSAAKSEQSAKEYSGKPPIIQNGTWWTWNASMGKYVGTGEVAKGNVMYATFMVNPTTGELWMYTDTDYAGPTFRIVNGNLEVVLNHG